MKKINRISFKLFLLGLMLFVMNSCIVMTTGFDTKEGFVAGHRGYHKQNRKRRHDPKNFSHFFCKKVEGEKALCILARKNCDRLKKHIPESFDKCNSLITGFLPSEIDKGFHGKIGIIKGFYLSINLFLENSQFWYCSNKNGIRTCDKADLKY